MDTKEENHNMFTHGNWNQDLWLLHDCVASTPQFQHSLFPSRPFLMFGGVAQVLFSMDQVEERLIEEVRKHDHLNKSSSEQRN